MSLEKDGVIVAALTDDTYGLYGGNLRAKDNYKPVGYGIDWKTVLTAFGVGEYRVKFDYGIGAVYSRPYDLVQYYDHLADGSVRIDFYRDSVIGSANQRVTRDFSGINWFDQMRFCNSTFGEREAPITIEESRYNSGYQRTVGKKFREEYTFTARSLSIEDHAILLYDILQSDDIVINLYNSRDYTGGYTDLAVEVDGSYKPSNKFNPSVTLKFKDKFDNRRKRYE
jgi:hypothetical protein